MIFHSVDVCHYVAYTSTRLLGFASNYDDLMSKIGICCMDIVERGIRASWYK